MAFIQVYFDDVLKDEVPLRTDPDDPVSIGRGDDNDIAVDNAGVSALHAVIWKEGGQFVIADTASKNGVMVNGEITHRKVLEFGDVIQLPKYKLRFVKSSAGVERPKPAAPPSGHAVQKATVEVDLARVAGLVAQRSKTSTAYLSVAQGDSAPIELPLNKVNVKIGKAADCDIRAGGWFAPPIAAVIVRRADGYYLKPEPRGRVRLNRVPIGEAKKLAHRDHVAVRGRILTFYDPASRPA